MMYKLFAYNTDQQYGTPCINKAARNRLFPPFYFSDYSRIEYRRIRND
jgi:hypothetical protein